MARVLVWSNAYWPMIGGVEVLGDRLMTELQRRGHELMVVTDRAEGTATFSVRNGIPIHRLAMSAAFAANNIETLVDVRSQITTLKRQFKPQLVWSYLVQFDCMFHLMTARAHQAPTLATMHGVLREQEYRAGSVVQQLLKSAAWTAACSSDTLNDTLQRVPEICNKSSVITNGLQMPDMAPSPLPFAEPRLLCLGRIIDQEEKGFDIAISAMAQILQAFPTTRLIVGGDGPGRMLLQQHAEREGVANQVDFPGWIAPEHVNALINESTIVLMPSRVAEGFGLVALQGMQLARPVVASHVGGLPGVVVEGETGTLVPPANSDAIANAVVDLLKNPTRATQLGLAGRARVFAYFGFDKHVDDYEALILRLTAHASSQYFQ